MSDTDRLEETRERKRDTLRERLEDGVAAEETDDDGAAEGAPDALKELVAR